MSVRLQTPPKGVFNRDSRRVVRIPGKFLLSLILYNVWNSEKCYSFFFQQRNVVFQIIIQSIRLVVISFCWPKKKLMVKKSLQFMWSNLDDEVFPQDVLFFSLELLQTAAGIVRNVSSKNDPSRNPMKNFVARVRWMIHPRFSGWLLNSWVSLEKE